ncbi:hypothetical protein [Roseivivax sp. CAU 1761]
MTEMFRNGAAAMPARLDSETAVLIRGFLRPIFDRATSWGDLRDRLRRRGYDLEVRQGRLLVIAIAEKRPICTGRDLGAPLAELAQRLGRLSLRLRPGGESGAPV